MTWSAYSRMSMSRVRGLEGAGRARRRDAARLALDGLGQPQEPVRRQLGLDLDRAVQMPRLPRRSERRPGRRLVDLGAGDDADRHLRAEQGQGRLEVAPPVSQIRAEREKDPCHA